MKIQLKPLDKINPLELAFHANDPRISTYLRNSFPYPYSLTTARNFIEQCIKNNNVEFGICVDNVCVGCIGATFDDDIYIHNVEIGYWINPDFWGKGIMSIIIPSFCQYLFQYYDIHKIYAIVISENISSIKLLEKCNFTKEGCFKDYIYKNNQFYDAVFYSLLEVNYGNQKSNL